MEGKLLQKQLYIGLCMYLCAYVFFCFILGFFFPLYCVLSCVECTENCFRLRRKMFVCSSSNSCDRCLVLSTLKY